VIEGGGQAAAALATHPGLRAAARPRSSPRGRV